MIAVTETQGAPRRGAGRPEATSHAEIEEAAFRLFAERGFDDTTLEAIAEEVGVSRRTLFRYYASKNDIPWGQFDKTLARFAVLLRAEPDTVPVWQAVHHAVRRFNEFPLDSQPPHVERMRLILRTPTLQSHSVLRYGDWRRVIEDYVAERFELGPRHPLPRLVGHVSLSLAVAAYDEWLLDPTRPLPKLVSEQMVQLRNYLAT